MEHVYKNKVRSPRRNKRVSNVAIASFITLCVAVIPVKGKERDLYGGVTAKKCSLGPRPHWYTEKISNRWWFCTPDGHAFYMHSIWNVNSSSATNTAGLKMGGALGSSRTRIAVLARRIQSWGFNAFDSYTARYGSPTANSDLLPTQSIPIVMGEALRPSYYGLMNTNNLVSQPTKAYDVMAWSNAQRSSAWRFQDIFDTQYKDYLRGMLTNVRDNAYNHVFSAAPERQKFVIGWSVDDTDWLGGFGAGGDFGTSVDGKVDTRDNKRHQHLGLLALYTTPRQGASARGTSPSPSGIIYGDPRTATVACMDAAEAGGGGLPGYAKGVVAVIVRPADSVCVKYALQRLLMHRYRTIDALNAAWGSSYTTFHSSEERVVNQFVAYTNGSDSVTFTVPRIDVTRQISPFSVGVYRDGTYIAADARYPGRNGNPFNCAVTSPNAGHVYGPELAGSYQSNDCPSTIDYATGKITLHFDVAPPAGQQIRVSYTINGWGLGTGLLDEDGRNPWLVDINRSGTDSFLLTGVNANIKADLDEFLYRYAYRYFKDVRSVIDSLTPGCDRTIHGTCYLYLGPSYLGTWGSPAYRQIVRAAAEFLDVYPYYTVPEYLPDVQQRVNFIYEHFGDKPLISWEAFTGGDDSPHPVDNGYQVRPRDNTQEARGAQYQRMVSAMHSLQYPNGSYPVIGDRYWDLRGSAGEIMNWGILTPNDDPIDGFCPGPGLRFELVRGGAPISHTVVSGATATVTTSKFHSVSVGTRVKIRGASNAVNLNNEFPVEAITSSGFTIPVQGVSPGKYAESTMEIEYVKYPCGDSKAVCMSCTTGSNRYRTTDSRFFSDPDGPYNNRFGDFLGFVRQANSSWVDLATGAR